MLLCCDAECHLCSVSIMLSVAYKPIMLSVIMLNVVMLSVVMLSVIMLGVVMLGVVMLSVIMLNADVYLLTLQLNKLECFDLTWTPQHLA